MYCQNCVFRIDEGQEGLVADVGLPLLPQMPLMPLMPQIDFQIQVVVQILIPGVGLLLRTLLMALQLQAAVTS
jgi:hypothetical protein